MQISPETEVCFSGAKATRPRGLRAQTLRSSFERQAALCACDVIQRYYEDLESEFVPPARGVA
jgi:hypothetical protein